MAMLFVGEWWSTSEILALYDVIVEVAHFRSRICLEKLPWLQPRLNSCNLLRPSHLVDLDSYLLAGRVDFYGICWDSMGFYGIWFGLHDLLLSFNMSPIFHDLVEWPCKLGPYAHGPCGSKGLVWFYLEEQLWPEQFLMMWAVGCCGQFGSVTHTYWMCVELLK